MPIAPSALPDVPVDAQLLTARQAAQTLSISDRTLWARTHDGSIRCVRIGRAVRYDPRDLREYIDRLRVGVEA